MPTKPWSQIVHKKDSTSLVKGFAELFAGRADACGTPNGGCLRVPSHEFHLLWEQHLNGAAPIGIYPMRRQFHAPNYNLPAEGEWRWEVKWGCVDLDIRSDKKPSGDYESEEECHTAAVNLQKVLKHLGVTSWIERTRSCGRHIWVFAASWVPAATMRRSLLTACTVGGVSTREVNPKQETLAEGQLGNYVRLPYPGGGCPLTQSVMAQGIPVFSPLGVDAFVQSALAARTSPQTLEAIASRYVSTKGSRDTPSIEFEDNFAEPAQRVLPRLNRAGASVFVNGPNDGDRSRGLSYLARQARNSGLSPSQALTLLAAAPWQKFRGRHDEEQRLREIVEWAWQ